MCRLPTRPLFLLDELLNVSACGWSATWHSTPARNYMRKRQTKTKDGRATTGLKRQCGCCGWLTRWAHIPLTENTCQRLSVLLYNLQKCGLTVSVSRVLQLQVTLLAYAPATSGDHGYVFVVRLVYNYVVQKLVRSYRQPLLGLAFSFSHEDSSFIVETLVESYRFGFGHFHCQA